jgi:2-polyprenyl-3-methyl-5-hydroxy-6-metoxy-1,4-benzoquinol methylase
MDSTTREAADWPVSGLEGVPVCPLCGATDRLLAHSGLRDYFFESAPGTWSLHQCGHCESGYLDPRPNSQTIDLAYSRYYTHQCSPAHKGLRQIWYALRDDYLQAVFGLRSEHTLWPGRWLLRLFPIGRQGIDTALARNLERRSGPGGRLLDVGCGNGNFLTFARRAGWLVKGVDNDPIAVATARAQGLDVIEGTLDLLDDESECYDRITISHVLEHVFDPWDLLARCYRLLKPDGVLWLETPNMNSRGRSVFGPYWRGLEPPRHLQLFSRKCLVAKIADLGFADIQDRFSSFATGAMWRESRVIMEKAGANRQLRHSLFGQLLAEIRAIFSPDSREFITLVCVKKNDKK